jgi:DNA polymerase elongation subunit (family B)
VADYQIHNTTALALHQLNNLGIRFHPGERVRYLIRDARSPNQAERVRAYPSLSPHDRIDVAAYQRMLLDAALELSVPFGYDTTRLRRALE